MDNKSSSGYDMFSNKIIKAIKNEISKQLTLIINQMLESGILPDSLKIAQIIPLYKKGNVNYITNYRPISLLPTLSKVFERVIFNQLYTYLDHNNLLSEQQYGFCTNHSAELADIKLVDYIVHEIDRTLTHITIYIDLSKAFDTLNLDILLYKLHHHGITNISLKLLNIYMSNRKQYVKYNVNESGFKEIKTGVPQGSILGPLLFSIYINDLSTVSNTLKFIVYAADITIYFNTEDFSKNHLAKHITTELDKVDDWLKHDKLSINVEKTKCMTFHTVRIMSNSEYLAHSDPLFKTLKVLKIEDLYRLKHMKIYYNLSYNLLPSYLNYYL